MRGNFSWAWLCFFLALDDESGDARRQSGSHEQRSAYCLRFWIGCKNQSLPPNACEAFPFSKPLQGRKGSRGTHKDMSALAPHHLKLGGVHPTLPPFTRSLTCKSGSFKHEGDRELLDFIDGETLFPKYQVGPRPFQRLSFSCPHSVAS